MQEDYTALTYMEHLAASRGIRLAEFDVAPAVVITWSPTLASSVARLIGAEPPHCWPEDYQRLYTTRGRPKVSVALAPIGAPGTVKFMEELIVCGARLFIGFGHTRSLQSYVRLGTLVLPTQAVSDEGTSEHYLGLDALSTLRLSTAAAKDLQETLQRVSNKEGIPCESGLLWSTDAPYRGDRGAVDSYRERGVLGIDMATSAMYNLGRQKKIKVSNFLVVSDALWDEWLPMPEAELKVATRQAMRALVMALREVEPLLL